MAKEDPLKIKSSMDEVLRVLMRTPVKKMGKRTPKKKAKSKK